MRAILPLVPALLLACNADDGASVSAPSSAPPANAVTITLAYSSEKKAWMEEELAAFAATNPSLPGGKPVLVEGTAEGSGEAMADILAGTLKPTVYSPASGAYVSLLDDAWLAAPGHSAPIAPAGDALVLSPVVIAMWKPMAEALGWPGTPIGWKDLLKVSQEAKGWGAYGHPEWGDFKLGHTHAALSNSGLLAALAEVYAATGKTRGLTPEDLPLAAPFLAGVEQSLVHYGKSTNFLMDKMVERGPSYVSAAVSYENLVVDAQAKPTELPLVAIYPVEGTFWCDHPYSVIDAEWVSADQKAAAKLLLDFLKAKPAQAAALRFGLRPADPAIAVGAPIDAAHGVDPTQPQTLLDVPDGRMLSSVLDLWQKNKKTSEVVLVFDKSGSMRGEPLQKAKEGARAFLDSLDDRDTVALEFFDNRVFPPGEPTLLGGGGRDGLKETVSGTVATGGTALYDAVGKAMEMESERAIKAPGTIHAVVVMTDGRDENSTGSLQDLLSALQKDDEAPVKVFTIAYGDDADPAVLQSIADAGKGAAAKGGTGDISSVFRDMAAFF